MLIASPIEDGRRHNRSRGLKSVLFIAYHFPPQAGSSGFLRTLKFVRYLPEHGWAPTVLSVTPGAYETLDPGPLTQVPPGVEVVRSRCLDAARHLSVAGRYPRLLALPDRWGTWIISAIPAGLRAIRSHRARILISTYPIATAMLIGFVLHRLSGVPWVADFRDSMTEPGYPRDPRTRKFYIWIERKAVETAARLLFTAPSACRMYLERYPHVLSEARCSVVPNGYDEHDFEETDSQPLHGSRHGPLTILHLGLLYPEERDPRPFFCALSGMKRRGEIASGSLRVLLRAPGSESYYRALLNSQGIEDIVDLLPAVPYRQALLEASDADALLLFQAACCNHQIPAKVYEYLRLRKPILALLSLGGDTAALLRSTGGATMIDIADEVSITSSLPAFLAALRSGSHCLPESAKTVCFDRRRLTGQLAQTLDRIVSP